MDEATRLEYYAQAIARGRRTVIYQVPMYERTRVHERVREIQEARDDERP